MTKCSNTGLIGISEEKERDKGAKGVSEDIMAKNFLNLTKNINLCA